MCELEIKIAYIKKYVYKERKETTHVEIGEETHIIIIYIYEKISIMYVKNGHKTGVQEANVIKKKVKYI